MTKTVQKFVASLCLVLMAAFSFGVGDLHAQNSNGRYGLTAWAINNQRVASQYNYDIDSIFGSGLGSYTFPCPVVYNALAFGGGKNVMPFNTNATVRIVDISNSLSETVALNSAATCSGGVVTLAVANSNAHTSYHLRSGTCGLAEALNDLGGAGGEVVVDQKFYDDGCNQATITGTTAAAIAQANQYVHDISNGQDTWYALKPTTLSLISAAGAALTGTGSAGGALTNSGTYLLNYEYVDPVGGIGLPNTESATVTLSSQNTITTSAPAAATGAVGWIPTITASGGSTGTEIEVPVTSAVCTLAPRAVIKPACAIGAAAVIAANPSSTAKQVVESTGHTTFAYQPVGGVPSFAQGGLGTPQTSFGPFAAVTTISSAGNADVAQFYMPAGALNYLGKTIDVCFKLNYSVTSTGVPTLKLQASNQYAQSPVTLATFLFATQAAAVTTNGCVTLSVAAVGSSGTFMANGWATQVLNSTQVGAMVGDVTTAASSTVDLTKGIYFSLNVAAATASVTALTVNSLTVRAVNGN